MRDTARYDDPAWDEYNDPYGADWQSTGYTTDQPAAQPSAYSGGWVMFGWAPNGSDWAPVYKGTDGKLYTEQGQAWSGDTSQLQTGDGPGGKPTWQPGAQAPPNSGQTYEENVIAHNTPLSTPPPVASGGVSVGGGGGGAPRATGTGSNPLTPYPGVFKPPDQAGSAAAALARLPGMPTIEPWKAPDPASILNDPSYQFRMSEGMKALENSGSARGLSLHPNLRQGLIQYGQGFASNEYQGLFDRELTGYKTNTGNQLDLFDRDLNRHIQAERGADDDYNHAFDEYELDWRQWQADQLNRINLLTNQSNTGANASR